MAGEHQAFTGLRVVRGDNVTKGDLADRRLIVEHVLLHRPSEILHGTHDELLNGLKYGVRTRKLERIIQLINYNFDHFNYQHC